MASEELEDVGWPPIRRETLASFRDVTRFMLARAIALREGTASGEAALFYWVKNARRIGVCRKPVGTILGCSRSHSRRPGVPPYTLSGEWKAKPR
jgi:hypothetical protein